MGMRRKYDDIWEISLTKGTWEVGRYDFMVEYVGGRNIENSRNIMQNIEAKRFTWGIKSSVMGGMKWYEEIANFIRFSFIAQVLNY